MGNMRLDHEINEFIGKDTTPPSSLKYIPGTTKASTPTITEVKTETDRMVDDDFRTGDQLYQRVMELSEEQTIDMSIPIPPDTGIYNAVKELNSDIGKPGNSITSDTYNEAYKISNSMDYTSQYDTKEVLWNLIKKFIGDWIAGKVEDVPVVGKDIADRLRDRNDVQIPMPMEYKARDILDYTRKYVGEPRELNFNPIALDLGNIARDQYRASLGTRNTINMTLGRKMDIGQIIEGDSLSEWASYNFKDAPRERISRKIMGTDLYNICVRNYNETTNDMKNLLLDYAYSEELACCLLGNISALLDTTGFTIRPIRLGLRYAYNGFNINTGSLYNMLIDAVNHLISLLMSKMMNTLTDKLDDELLKLNDGLRTYLDGKAPEWKRCYPFDELLQSALNGIDGMSRDLLAYINDWINTWKLTNINTNDYLFNIYKRERLRWMINLTEKIEMSGALLQSCKSLDDMHKANYIPRVGRDSYTGRMHENTIATLDTTPVTGDIYSDAPSPSTSNRLDMDFLRKCSQVIDEKKVEELGQLLGGI